LRSFPEGPYSSESSLVSQQPIQPMVDEVVSPMKSFFDPNILLESDDYSKVISLMQSSTDTTLLLGSDAYFNCI
jgi:hypothetical protein